VKTILGRLYRIAERWLLSRLPDAWQVASAAFALRIARRVFPQRSWPEFIEPASARRLPRVVPRSLHTLPKWARQDMDDLARRVDPLLTPALYIAGNHELYAPPIHWQDAGATYRRLSSRLRGHYDTVLVVPWLKRGGADLGALHHARACHEVFGQRTLVIATEPSDSPWAARLPDGVEFLEAGEELARLSAGNAEPETVLARLLIQLRPQRVHFIGSHTGWRTLVRHGHALSSSADLYASLYCDDRNKDGYRDGPAVRYLSSAAGYLKGVITDNTVSPREWIGTLGVDPALFHVVHFPAPESASPTIQRLTRQRLLWASRMDVQKRPELLAKLVTALPDYHWDIYGSQVVPGHGGDASNLGSFPNVTLHGPYDDFMQIIDPAHLAFVYTSAWDGLPNVLLEAAAAGLPVVAPHVGGISDLIPADLLIRPDDDVERFVQAIRSLSDEQAREECIRRQSERLADFTWRAFVDRLRNVPGYAG